MSAGWLALLFVLLVSVGLVVATVRATPASWTWTEYRRETGELVVHQGRGKPCVCAGDDLPHPRGWRGCETDDMDDAR